MKYNWKIGILIIVILLGILNFFFLIFIIDKTSNSTEGLFFFLIWSIAIYSIVFYSHSVFHKAQPYWMDGSQDLNQDFIEKKSSYTPIDEIDLLHLWWQKQKRGFMGKLRKIPSPENFNTESIQKSLLAEVEAEAEYYTSSDIQRILPYSKASQLNYHKDPYPVVFPQNFINEIQEYPIFGTLKKRSCDICGGSGKIICSWCGGSGKVTCSRCGGSGKVTCSRCGGSGTQTVSSSTWDDRGGFSSSTRTESCTSCGGWGKQSCSCFGGRVSCSSCMGSGRVICSTCKGEGNLGSFIAKRYEFIHWKKTHVFKEHENQLIDMDISINDLPNDDARLIVVLDDYILTNLKEHVIPKINNETIKALLRKKQEFKLKIENLDNVLFNRYTFREFPELKIVLSNDKREYTLIGLGYKPLQEKYMIADNYKISILRIFYLLASIIILIVMIYFFLLF